MTTGVSEVYEAFRLAGVDEDRARRAAQAVVLPNPEPRLAKIEADGSRMQGDIATLTNDVGVLKSDVAMLKIDVAGLKTDVAGLKTDGAALRISVALLQWMTGALIAAAFPGGWLLLRIAAKIGAV